MKRIFHAFLFSVCIAWMKVPDLYSQTNITKILWLDRAELKITPRTSGIYGIEVNVLANSVGGNLIDRAVLLTLGAQPTWVETAKNQIFVTILVVGLLVLNLA